MIIKNIDSKGNKIDFQKIESLVLNNDICQDIISEAMKEITVGQKSDER